MVQFTWLHWGFLPGKFHRHPLNTGWTEIFPWHWFRHLYSDLIFQLVVVLLYDVGIAKYARITPNPGLAVLASGSV